jgi:hypothetical protein
MSPPRQPSRGYTGFAIPDSERKRRLERHERFWEAGYAGEGAYFAVTVPLEPRHAQGIPTLERFLDSRQRVKDTLEEIEHTWYGGDALPIAQVDFGPGILPAVLGRPYRLGEGTVWFDEHAFDDPAELAGLVFNEEAPIYRSYRETTRLLAERSQGRYSIALCDIGSTTDVLAALYNRQNLLIDCALEPERVIHLLARIGDFWQRGVGENLRLLRESETHISTWIPIINRRDWYAQLSEFSVMLSPRDFEKYSLPVLAREAELFEQIVFNLDGDSYAHHLPEVLKIPKLHAIDWAPTRKYVAEGLSYKIFTEPLVLEVARAIQQQMKLVVNGIPHWQVAAMLEQIEPDGVFFIVDCDTPPQAEEFLESEARGVR